MSWSEADWSRSSRPTSHTRPRPFLDLTGRLGNIGPEQGLHSIAFHPNFAKNGRFFVHYTTSKKELIVAEFKGKACGVANNKPVKTILFEKQEYINNNGGWIDFGPDGKLYVATGDGGGPAPGDPKGLGQTPSTRLGKILRIDVDRKDGIARDNPYVKVAKKWQAQAAWGLRSRDLGVWPARSATSQLRPRHR